jgi:hypothetical protein
MERMVIYSNLHVAIVLIWTDEYGGSFENRIRLTLEVLEAVQSEWPKELPFICANFS